MNSRSLLGSILTACENDFVPTDAKTRRTILKPAIEALTVEACHDQFVKAWKEGELSISATGNLDLGSTGGKQLRDIYEASAKTAVEAPEAKESGEFAYPSDPSRAGAVVDRKHIDDLDFEVVRFKNGVALNLKKTDFKENEVIVNVAFGEGSLTLDPESARVMQTVAGSLINGAGLEAHSADDLRRILAGKQVGWGFGIGDDRFTASGSTTAEDLLLQFELMSASFTSPGWQEDGLVQLRRQIPMMFEQMKHSPAGPAQMDFLPALYSGDPRQAFPAREDLETCGVEEVRSWMTPILKDAPIEVTVVGDIDIDETIAMAARTFGTLPTRRDWDAHDDRRNLPAPKAGLRQTHGIESVIPKSLVLICFPTTDGIDITRMRRLNMLNQVVNDRLRLEVRERLGAAYSPGSMSQASSVHPGVGMVMMQAMADPDKVDTLVDACLAVADTMAKEGITDEELDRLREPILNQRRDWKRTNGYWINVMSRAQSDPKHVEDMRIADDFYMNVKAEEIAPLASEFLKSERASILVVNPTPKE